MKPAVKGTVLLSLTIVPSLGLAWAAEQIVVFKSSSCQCCNKWIEHLRQSGFEVRASNIEAMGAVKARFGVPSKLRSCHTAEIGGYVIEGHVTAADVLRLLRERPKVTGLAVPGMPRGSPGMEGARKQPYPVVNFTRDDGASAIFANH